MKKMRESLVSIIQVTYTTLLPLVLAYIVKTVKDIRISKDTGREADVLILRLILVDMHDRYMKQGYITNQGFMTFTEIWELYHEKFKGNHLTDKFKKEVESLPIRTESWEVPDEH